MENKDVRKEFREIHIRMLKEAEKKLVENFIVDLLKRQRKEIIQIVLEDVPTKYQERLIEMLK